MKTEFLKGYNLVFPSFLVQIVKKFSLNFEDFLLLTYFWNYKEENFNVLQISKVLKLTENEILTSFTTLINKKLIQIDTLKDGNGKHIEVINLEYFYQEVILLFQERQKEEEKQDVYSIFESEFGRPISSIEYEIIHAWIEKGFTEELILGALKEAVYNGVNNLRYIDKILYEWQRKGYKTVDDVHKDNFNRNVKKEETKELFDYNWLEDNEG